MSDTDVDLSEFFRLSRPKKKPCAVGFAISQVKGQEQSKLLGAIATDANIITNAAVSEWLAQAPRKINVTISAVVAHRKGTCSCAD